jgi:hypothetical protein
MSDLSYDGSLTEECVFPRLHCDCVDCIERRSKFERMEGLVVRAPTGRNRIARMARDVPNRLYGATINHEGDAV